MTAQQIWGIQNIAVSQDPPLPMRIIDVPMETPMPYTQTVNPEAWSYNDLRPAKPQKEAIVTKDVFTLETPTLNPTESLIKPKMNRASHVESLLRGRQAVLHRLITFGSDRH